MTPGRPPLLPTTSALAVTRPPVWTNVPLPATVFPPSPTVSWPLTVSDPPLIWYAPVPPPWDPACPIVRSAPAVTLPPDCTNVPLAPRSPGNPGSAPTPLPAPTTMLPPSVSGPDTYVLTANVPPGHRVGAFTQSARVRSIRRAGCGADDQIPGNDVRGGPALVERPGTEPADRRAVRVERSALEVIGAGAVEVGADGEQSGAAEHQRAGVEGSAGLQHRTLGAASDFRELTGDRAVGQLVTASAEMRIDVGVIAADPDGRGQDVAAGLVEGPGEARIETVVATAHENGVQDGQRARGHVVSSAGRTRVADDQVVGKNSASDLIERADPEGTDNHALPAEHGEVASGHVVRAVVAADEERCRVVGRRGLLIERARAAEAEADETR